MSKLTTKARKALPASEFALPGGRYPIPDAAHGRNALSRAHFATPSEQATIKRKVHAKFPGIGADAPHGMQPEDSVQNHHIKRR